MIPKTVDSTNFNFGRLLGLSMRGKKPVELMTKSSQVSMVTDLHKGVFNQILLKMTENDHKFKLQLKFQNYCYSF